MLRSRASVTELSGDCRRGQGSSENVAGPAFFIVSSTVCCGVRLGSDFARSRNADARPVLSRRPWTEVIGANNYGKYPLICILL